MNSLMQDVAKGIRSLRRSRGFVIVTVLSLGLALGVTTTMFGLVDAVLNPVVPVTEAEKLVRIANYGDGAGHDVTWRETLEAPRRSRDLFSGTALQSRRYSLIRVGQHYDRQTVSGVNPEFFDLTGIRPFLGSVLRFSDAGGAGDAAMISFRLWRSALGGRRDLGEANVEVNGRIYRVVGVLPPFLPGDINAGVYVPFDSTSRDEFGNTTLIARLAPGVVAAEAQNVLRTTADPVLKATFGVGRQPFRYRVLPILDTARAEMSNLQKVLLASALVVLIIACGNLGNLMLARGLARERDFALSFALGARRINIIRQSIAEAVVCALGGAAVGTLIAAWAFHVVTYKMQREVPALGVGLTAVSLNWRVFGFAFLAALGTALVAALIPAVRTSSVEPNVPLKSAAGTTTGRSKSRFSALVIGELALTMSLLLGAGLLTKAVAEMEATDLGYEPRGLLTIHTFVPVKSWREHRVVSINDMLHLREHIEKQPGILAASLEGTGVTPKLGPALASTISGGGNRKLYSRSYSAVGPEYITTLGARIIDGRDFTGGDATDAGAVIVNETAARQLWLTESPVGQMLKLGDVNTSASWLPVVGVVQDTRPVSTVMPAFESLPEVWVVPPTRDSVNLDRLLVRVPPSGVERFRAELHRMATEVLPPGTIVVVESVLDGFDDERLARAFVGRLFIVFGGIALGLAAVGLYSLLSFTVTERRRELAVRCALGATGGQCARDVLHDAATMILAGTGIGAFVSMWLARHLDEMLYSVFYTDVTALLAAELAILCVALAASLVPAFKAARTDPVELLRAS